MKEIFAAEKTKTFLMSICLVAFGILFVAMPQDSYNVLTKIIAWALVAIGAVMILHYFINFKPTVKGSIFVNGVLFLGFGMLLLFVPKLYTTFIGIVLSFAGIQAAGNAFEQKKRLEKHWWHDLVSGVVNFVIGVVLVVLSHTSVAQSTVMVYLGVSLILDGIYLLVAMFFFKKVVKKVENAVVEEVEKTVTSEEEK